MKVKVGHRWFSAAAGEPIMIELSEADRKNIADMLPSATRYACFNDADQTTADEKRAWMAAS